MTVGIVTNLYPSRDRPADGAFVQDLANELVKSGCKVRVLHHRNPGALLLETLARRSQFDILDAQFIAPSGVIASLTPKFCPLVVTVHRVDIVEFPYRWPTASQWTRFALRRADGIVAVSKYISNEVAKFNNDFEKVRVIPNAVDTSRFKPSTGSSSTTVRSRLGVPEDSFLIFSIGRLVPIKGFQHLLHAMRKVVGKDRNVALVVAGDGPYRPTLESLARSLGITERVRFVGRIQHEDSALTDLYCACDLFALTSLHEGHSVSITEAMACGKPILCSDIPGNRELVIGNFNGILVPYEQHAKIAIAIEALYESRRLLDEYGKNSRKLALERYSWSNRIESILEFYELLRDRHPTRREKGQEVPA